MNSSASHNFTNTKMPHIDQRTTGYHERFRFTGKERDKETGYGYFGARYMDHELTTMWLSVDPMADKYPGISPYAYCSWNPIKLVDPDGQEDWEVDKLGHITKCQEQQENPTEDRIRIKGTTGWTEKNSISGLKRFTITDPVTVPLENASTDYGSLISMGGTEDDRLNVFKFCASNANVEFSLMEIVDGNNHFSYLTTSHDEHLRRKEKIGDGLGSAVAVRFFDKLQLHIHNHFTGKVGWGPNEDDYGFKENINNLRNDYQQKNPDANLPEVKFMIYKCRGNDKQTISY